MANTRNEMVEQAKKRFFGYSLDFLLEEITVMTEFENDISDKLIADGWAAVCDDTGIIAYFSSPDEAYHFRLDYINRIMN